MRFVHSSLVLVVILGVVMIAACTSGPGFAPKLAVGDPAGLGILGITGPQPRHHFVSNYSCPATGSLKYVSDPKDNVINIYFGKFAGQAPCGQIANSSLNVPVGLYVRNATHDLYVANNRGLDVLVFHRGKTSPYNTYTDPSGQFVLDVTMTPDGSIVASNVFQKNGNELGSISTWIGGPKGGTFVGNFSMTNAGLGTFVTSRKSGKVYFDDVDKTNGLGAIWSVSCPLGACGTQTQVAGVSLQYPGGMAVDESGDLLVSDQSAATADTFELPNPKPSTFPLTGYPECMAIDKHDHDWFESDGVNNVASEYSYPSGNLVGTVSGNPGGETAGIAVDP